MDTHYELSTARGTSVELDEGLSAALPARSTVPVLEEAWESDDTPPRSVASRVNELWFLHVHGWGQLPLSARHARAAKMVQILSGLLAEGVELGDSRTGLVWDTIRTHSEKGDPTVAALEAELARSTEHW